MKLFYYSFRKGITNFGDDLNPWLWDRLIPGLLDNNPDSIFVGIGTLLNNYVPKARHIAVFGSGVGYGKDLPKIGRTWHIYCLRGPLSAQALGVSEDLAVTDGAFLIRKVYQSTGIKKYKFSFMPHIEHRISQGQTWKNICESIGFHYIDPGDSIENVLSEISATEILLAEAMHGAIVADALRVPWIPICTDGTILPFKWQDWCSSVKLDYRPNYIFPWGLYPLAATKRRTAEYVLNAIRQNQLSLVWQIGSDRDEKLAIQLERVAQKVSPVLSDDKIVEQRTEQLEQRLSKFKNDVLTGQFQDS